MFYVTIKQAIKSVQFVFVFSWSNITRGTDNTANMAKHESHDIFVNRLITILS